MIEKKLKDIYKKNILDMEMQISMYLFIRLLED